NGDFRAVDFDASGRRLVEAEKAIEDFRPSGSHQAVDAENLPLADGEGDILDLVWATESGNFETDFRSGRVGLDVFFRELATDDHANEAGAIDVRERPAADIGAIAKHRVGIG